MKITAIQTSNFIGARAVDVKLTKPVALFAGKNGAGKSSLSESINGPDSWDANPWVWVIEFRRVEPH